MRIISILALLFLFSGLAHADDKEEKKNELKLQIGGYIDSQFGSMDQSPTATTK